MGSVRLLIRRGNNIKMEPQEPVGPGWVARDISEIKPGAFQAMRSLENQYDSLRQEDVRDKATTDPMHKYYKRLLPKPRDPEYRGKYQRPEREEDYRNPKPRGLKYETSDRGLALVENFMKQRNPGSTDLSQLKTQFREEALRESDQVRSRIKPNSAHKVYAWRDLLEERELKSQNYSCTKLPSEVFMPDKTKHLLTLFHKDHQAQGKVKRMNGYWQVPRLGPTPTRDRYGLKILNNLQLESQTEVKAQTCKGTKDYHYSWPYTDTNAGESIKDWVKVD